MTVTFRGPPSDHAQPRQVSGNFFVGVLIAGAIGMIAGLIVLRLLGLIGIALFLIGLILPLIALVISGIAMLWMMALGSSGEEVQGKKGSR